MNGEGDSRARGSSGAPLVCYGSKLKRNDIGRAAFLFEAIMSSRHWRRMGCLDCSMIPCLQGSGNRLCWKTVSFWKG